ncbi:hypothetical protein MPNT_130015 [Candidatus Methylacidithermus pantelleriae]|uniref:Uncharacterized protein n=1 Tax=Candidatus Methylacidithermus pantelleriae TaxID=2744239 RepID=A0A8J2BI97_9BACT|nr:hypothetical protein MPNT_130015 [Candidatus Methylacidithermus pantelleriae]
MRQLSTTFSRSGPEVNPGPILFWQKILSLLGETLAISRWPARRHFFPIELTNLFPEGKNFQVRSRGEQKHFSIDMFRCLRVKDAFHTDRRRRPWKKVMVARF